MPHLGSWHPRGGRGCCDLDLLVRRIVDSDAVVDDRRLLHSSPL